MDRSFGDVLMANSGMCRLIEFKRQGTLTKKELLKLKALRAGLDGSDQRELGRAISRSVHWFVTIRPPEAEGEPALSQACPYVDFNDEDASFQPLGEFAADAAREACDDSVVDEVVRNSRSHYLKWVAGRFAAIEDDFRASASAAGKKSRPSGALMVAMSRNGVMRWLAVPEIEHTMMNPLELAAALRSRYSRDHNAQRDGRHHGYSYSL